MTVIDHPQERAWLAEEAETVALMGTINLAVAKLVATIGMLIDTGGWYATGIKSVEHWVTWKACVSRDRAENLVRIARRIDDLPACWALFAAGRLTEDATSRIARRVPAERDVEVAGWASGMLVSQLRRALASCPELPDPAPHKPPQQTLKERFFHTHEMPDGWLRGEFCLPPSEAPIVKLGLSSARDAEFRDRQGLEPDAEVEGMPGRHTGRTRMASCGWPRRRPTPSTPPWPARATGASETRSTHHRELHDDLFSIDGNPEDGSLRFLDRFGRPIEPPKGGPPAPLRVVEPSPYTPPFGERLDPLWFTWN